MPTPIQVNPYYGPLNVAFTRLVSLNGTFHQLAGYWNLRRKEIERNLKGRRGARGGPASGAAPAIRDLTEWPSDGWARYFSVGVYQRRGRRFLSALDEIVSANAAWGVSQSFEALETFLKDTAAVYLKRHPKALSETAWTPLRKATASIRPTSRRLAAYRAFVRQAYGGTDDVVKRLRRSVSALQQSEQQNNRGLDLQAWLRVVSQVRHAVVHSGSVLSPGQLGRLSAAELSLLHSNFPGVTRAGSYRLRLTAKSGSEAINRFAEYALLVFKELSKQDSLDWNVFRSVRIRV